MRALVYDRTLDEWSTSRGMELRERPEPTFHGSGEDRDSVLVRVLYTGFCGSDRGIWSRRSFGDMILGSLAESNTIRRTFGHEMLAEIVQVGDNVTDQHGFVVGDHVSTESHIVCGTCFQCRMGEFHVCAQEQIIGITVDGCFADLAKLPAKALWRTDLNKIRPEVAAIQEPFGNAVHACQVTDLQGRTVAIFGTGAIGLFAVLVAKGLGAAHVIGVDPNPHHRSLAKRLGADLVLAPAPPPPNAPHLHDKAITAAIKDFTNGVGADVCLEMAGYNDSINNAIAATRRGGQVVLFGVRNGDKVIEDAHRIVMNGIQLQGVVGRRLFATWEITQALLENKDNGIQEAIWNVILNQGSAVYPISSWSKADFEQVLLGHPKAIIKWQ